MPGFDPVGLWVYHTRESSIASITLGHGLDIGIIPKPRGDDPLGQPVIVDLPATACVSTIDASTRDRVARRVAQKMGVLAGASTAPEWAIAPERTRWSLWDHFERRHGNAVLAGVDILDPRLLPDGSRWVDAAALAAVARTLRRWLWWRGMWEVGSE